MNRTTALVVEDERLAAEALERMLSQDAEVDVVGIARDGKTAVELIRKHRPHIVFLDIEIPEMNGFQVIQEVGLDQMPIIVFVTAYDKYTLQAFEVHALDYLLKPFDEERFQAAVRHAKQESLLRRRLQQKKLASFMDSVASQGLLKRYPIKSSGKIVFVDVDDIDYLEAAGNYVRLHVGPQQYITRETMNAFEARLSDSNFVRIHRSVIVNRRRIKELKPWFTGEYAVILTTGKELTLSRGYRDRLPLLLTAE